MPPLHPEHRRGLFYAVAAYGLWGIIPLYFRLLVPNRVTAWELVGSRAIWSFIFLILVVSGTRAWPIVRKALQDRRTMLALAASAVLIGTNWFAYVYAVATDQILQASLGYFITPLMSMGLGVVLLGERLKPLQTVGIALAAFGVVIITIAAGELPWIALALAVSFSLYGLARKSAAVDSASALLIETAILLLPAVGLLAYLRMLPGALPIADSTHVLLALGGIVTATPLMFFGAAARRLPLTSLGIMQYVSPSIQFLLAVILFHEPFGAERSVGFVCIWVALAIYTYASLPGRRRAPASVHEPIPEEVIETA